MFSQTWLRFCYLMQTPSRFTAETFLYWGHVMKNTFVIHHKTRFSFSSFCRLLITGFCVLGSNSFRDAFWKRPSWTDKRHTRTLTQNTAVPLTIPFNTGFSVLCFNTHFPSKRLDEYSGSLKTLRKDVINKFKQETREALWR